jgi:sugar phosphate isomerase/epimerase
VENFPPPFFTSDEEELLRLLDEFPEHLVGACIDTGHAHLGGRLVDFARLLAPRTFVAHLHDNFARAKDEHLIPGRGTIPWGELVEALRTGGFRGQRVIEVNAVGTLGETLEKVKTAIVETGLSELVIING